MEPRLEEDWGTVYQTVIPTEVLSAAHDGLASHMGVTKTYNRIRQHFFWPGLKRDVAGYCKSCHVCQVSGKPNQAIPTAPLQPIPAIGDPFEHVIIDCVGPLPIFINCNVHCHSFPGGYSSKENYNTIRD